MTRFRKKGDVEWFRLSDILSESWDKDRNEAQTKLISDLTGIEIGIEHIGPEQAELWGLEAHRLRLEDLARVFALQRKFTRDQLPALYAEDDRGNLRAGTAEARREQLQMAKDVLAASVNGVRGDHPLSAQLSTEKDKQKVACEIVRWGVGVEVMEKAIEIQSLTAEDIFT